jgi:hypothetical protein
MIALVGPVAGSGVSFYEVGVGPKGVRETVDEPERGEDRGTGR